MSESRLRNLAFTSLGHFINDGTIFFVPLVADIFASLKEASPFELTVMFVVFYGSASLLSPYVGRLADKTGRPGPLIGAGILLLSLGMFGYYATLEYMRGTLFLVSLVASAFSAGFGSAFYHPLGASVLQSSFDDAEQGRALGINGAVGSIGRALYPTMFFFVAVFLSTDGSLAFFAGVGVASSVGIWLGLRSQGLPRTSDDKSRKTATGAKSALTSGIILLTLVSFIRSLATSGIISWIPIYISSQKGLGVTGALGFALTVMFSTAIVGQPLFGWLVDKFDRRIILAISSAGSALTILIYLFTSGLVEMLVLALFGFFTFTAFPLLLALASNYELEGSSSLGNALVWGLGTSGGSVIGPLITGALVLTDYSRLRYAFEIMAVGALVSAAATLLLPKAMAGKKTRPPVTD
jgi:FSR family fosmidomycin resistance protein-like MFS transporter